MTIEERLEKLERELARAKRRNRWLLVTVSLTAAVVLAGPLAEEGLGQLSRVTQNLPWWEKLLVEGGVLGFAFLAMVAVGLGVAAVGWLWKRIHKRPATSRPEKAKGARGWWWRRG